MLTFLQYLNEFVFADLHPKKDDWEQIPLTALTKAQHEPSPNIDTELYDLLAKSYAYIGGHVDFRKPSDIPSNHTIWYATDVDGDKIPDAVKFGKMTQFGMKWTGGGNDGSSDGKYAYVENTVQCLRTPGHYAEVSDAIMHILITRFKIECVDDEQDVRRILGKPVKWIGKHPEGKYPGYAGFYERELGGAKHMKILLGKPRI